MRVDQTSLVQLSVFFDELDIGGVLYHANYIKLCDRARSIALAEIGCPLQSLFEEDFALAVVRCDNTYYKPLRMQDVWVASRLVSWSERSLSIRHAIFDLKADRDSITAAGDNPGLLPNCYFSAETKLVAVKLKTMSSTSIPSNLRKALDIPTASQ